MSSLMPLETKLYKNFESRLGFEWVMLQEGIDKETKEIVYRTFDWIEYQEDYQFAYFDGSPPGYPDEADVDDYLKIRQTMNIHSYAGQKYVSIDFDSGDGLDEFNDFVGWKHVTATYTLERMVLNPKQSGGGKGIQFRSSKVFDPGYEESDNGKKIGNVFYVLEGAGPTKYFSKKTKEVVANLGGKTLITTPVINGVVEVNWYYPEGFDSSIDPNVDPSQGTLIPITGQLPPEGVTKVHFSKYAIYDDFSVNFMTVGGFSDEEGITTKMEMIDYVDNGWLVHANPPDLKNPVPPPGVNYMIPSSEDELFKPLDEFTGLGP